jgi:hypothetical protein
MIIVLETSGKHESVDTVKVKLFTSKVDAEKYCTENTDNPMENSNKVQDTTNVGNEVLADVSNF